jgi:hypothetical protein
MTYETARTALEQTPVSRAVIFTLVGCAPHERCVIERTEDAFITREDDTCAANDWVPIGKGASAPGVCSTARLPRPRV